MTWALCLNCGEVKFGAICPCPKCEMASTGDMSLDIAMSDHHISKQSLHELGEIVATIHQASTDDELCFWSFIRYVSVNHPSILGVELKPELESRCDLLLSQISIPRITLIPTEKLAANAETKPNKKWWQFWK